MTIRRLPLLAMALAFLLAACGSDSPAPAATTPSQGDPAPSAAVSGLVPVTLAVPEGMDAAPLNTQRQALVPPGWTLSVFARVPSARQAAWAPDGTLLVSVPENGTVVRLEPDGRGTATVSALLTGLNQPHGLAFSGSALYVAQSDRVNAFAYAAGQATNPRPVVTDLPDARSPDLRGRYAHALKSVAVSQDGSVYVSVGSTGNISADDLTATPPRASILRVPPGGGPPEPFAVGVRNGTALAVAPDGAVWTAVNNRDNIQFPYDRPYGDDPGSARGQVIDEYVRDHPVEPFAKLTPGRNLGWPYCNPDADVDPGVRGSRQDFSDVPFTRDVQTNPDGRMLDCAALPPVEQALPGHSAPLGLSFVDGDLPGGYASGALVGIHGSWNASPPRAPEVSFFPWRNGDLGGQQTLVGGFQTADGSRWGRPVAAVAGPDRAVYITDDQADAVYRLAPPAR
ncbi:SMP-30/gluconolaconase/LRE-like region [Parafrankia sp. Ea1.12]|uniref:PQQ-dependent sugar dehydrogenase n=1 Tax=Parafrankia sp. Ea1.12 TaxID=573499 RepID=UPI000DA55844|nr:gluconolaconase [Parafrankia sp. Ea1.12]SQE00176.1 SMP-30/gluconolaconase/LRE-like region [Parafrankia sp. Ea1.12]